jgi:hypothetical protein
MFSILAVLLVVWTLGLGWFRLAIVREEAGSGQVMATNVWGWVHPKTSRGRALAKRMGLWFFLGPLVICAIWWMWFR